MKREHLWKRLYNFVKIIIKSNLLSVVINFDIITLYESKKKEKNNADIWGCFCKCYDTCNVRFFVVASFVYVLINI